MIVSALRAVLAVALVVPLAACASDSLSERDARSVRLGQVLDASYTAAVRGTQAHVMLPSGRLDLTLTEPVDEVPAQDAAAAAPLRPTGGATIVGVAWALNRGAYSNTYTRQLAAPETLLGVPKPARLWLVTDGTRREIPDVATLLHPKSRPSNAAWLVVPADVRRWHFDVGYAGVTQRVDARSGKVTAGVAAPLYRPLPLNYRGSCEFRNNTQNFTSCSVEFAAGLPYVDGAGWAPAGKVFVVVKIVSGSVSEAGENVLVAGTRSVALLNGSSEQFRAYLVTPARTYPVRGSAPAEDDDGGTVTLPLTGTLATDGTAP